MENLRLTPQHTFLWDAWNAIPRIESDVVHSFYFYDSLAASLRRGAGRKYGVVLQLNGVPIPGVSCRRFLPPEGLAMRRAIREVDRCIVCSEFVRGALREHLNGEAVVIPPPVDPEAWPCGTGERADPPVILAVGNFNERRKGIRPLVKAFALMRNEGRNVRLRVSGTVDAPLREELLNSVQAPVAAHIEFLGLGRPEDLPILYQTATVLALPAMWEPSGTVMMEAWLSGTPVVAPRHGGLPEFFAAGTGFLFDPLTTGEETPNVEGLAEALDNAASRWPVWRLQERGAANMARRFLPKPLARASRRSTVRSQTEMAADSPALIISVVIPCYRRPDLAVEAARSALRQRFDPARFEVVAVDSSPDDAVVRALESLRSEAPCRFEIYRKEPEGPGPSRNLGAARSAGKYIAFLDSDCQATEGWLEALVVAFEDHIGIVQGRTLPIPSKAQGIFSHTLRVEKEGFLYETANIAYARPAFEKAGGFLADRDPRAASPARGEDTDLAWRVRRMGWHTCSPTRRWFITTSCRCESWTGSGSADSRCFRS